MTAAIVFIAGPVFAGGQLTADLTPTGAIKAGNAEGSIPEWTGGITAVPGSYRPGGYHTDPFADDKPLYTITSQNWTQYKDKLSEAHQSFFQKYPDYVISVYPTRRSASFPDYVYEALKKNAGSAQLKNEGNAIEGGSITSPFPVPENGLEAVWNHLLRFRSQSLFREKEESVVIAGPKQYITYKIDTSVMFPYSNPGMTYNSPGNILVYYKQNIFSPPSSAGTLLLAHEMLNKVKEKRRSWLYNPGLRRVNRAPFISYDTYAPSSEGVRTYDQFDMYNGATDRYDWTLEGRKEIIVPYNAYKLASQRPVAENILWPHFMNPDYTRYELHRVWKVTATLKKGSNHLYARRTFYLDEDSWQILITEQYDGRGELWHCSESHTINYYEAPLILPTADVHYDLKSGRYVTEWQTVSMDLKKKLTVEDFTPENLRHEGAR